MISVTVVVALIILILVVVLVRHPGAKTGGTTLPTSAGTVPGGGRSTTPTSASSPNGEDDKLHVAPHPPILTRCESSPHTCGYPDATNTGVPAATALTSSGALVVSANGTVIDHMNVTGSIVVQASNVTIQNTRVTCANGCSARFAIEVRAAVTGLVIHDVELTGSTGVSANVGGGGQVTLLRSNLSGSLDGIHLISGSVVRDSYIHDLTPTPSSHDDAAQQIPPDADGVTLVHNTLIPYNFASNIYNNSAFICGARCKSTTNMVFTDNFVDGGSHTLQCPFRGTSGNVFARNHFGHNYRFGPITAACLTTPGDNFDRSTNVFDDTGAPVG